ncbi:hypothetical protein AGMMS50276_33130 [Synergistales bacterium]|nr:hypothetical protein AGMMS50276_33130 [Synergistales bacterium]
MKLQGYTPSVDWTGNGNVVIFSSDIDAANIEREVNAATSEKRISFFADCFNVSREEAQAMAIRHAERYIAKTIETVGVTPVSYEGKYFFGVVKESCERLHKIRSEIEKKRVLKLADSCLKKYTANKEELEEKLCELKHFSGKISSPQWDEYTASCGGHADYTFDNLAKNLFNIFYNWHKHGTIGQKS